MGGCDRAEDRELKEAFLTAAANVDRHMEEKAFHRALESIFVALDKTNQYIVQTAPFTLVKDPDQKARVGEILHHVLEGVRLTGELLAPFLPETGVAVRNLLGLPASDALRTEWGGSFPEGHQVQPPEILFPRIEETGKRRGWEPVVESRLGYGNGTDTRIVIPAKAGIQGWGGGKRACFPAPPLDSRFRGNDDFGGLCLAGMAF